LFVAAGRAPHLPRTHAPLHNLPDGPFIDLLGRRYNAIPEAILADPELVEFYLPILRADFRMAETYPYGEDAPLDCPIVVFGGTEDEWAPAVDLEAWRAHTHGPFKLQLFPGGHFFLDAARPQLLAAIARELSGDAEA
jgi:medium-chain acyl-[acyl-carrier-protein] hydrolase